MEDGLSQGTIRAIVQDHKGFMWIGTQDGLNRFDGVNFKVYRHDPENQRSLAGNQIRGLLEDSQNRLWIATAGGGLSRFDRDSGEFANYTHDPDNSLSIRHNVVLAVYEDRLGRIWIGTGEGLDRLDPETGTFSHILLDSAQTSEEKSIYSRAICEGRDGTLWIGTNWGLFAYKPKTGEVEKYTPEPDDPHSLSTRVVLAVLEDGFGVLWAGTTRGLEMLDGSRDRFVHVRRNPGDPQSLVPGGVQSICEDQSGDLWFAANGVSLLSVEGRDSVKFVNSYHDDTDPNSLSDNSAQTFCLDQSGALWEGTLRGLNRLSRGTPAFSTLQHYPGNENSLSHNFVLSIREDRRGNIWVGTLGGGLNMVAQPTGQVSRFAHHPENPNSLASNDVRAVMEDHLGTIWIGTSKGLNVYDPVSAQMARYPSFPLHSQGITGSFVHTLHIDPSNQLWVGAHGGATRIERIDSKRPGPTSSTGPLVLQLADYCRASRYTMELEGRQPRDANAIYTFFTDHNGAQWIGTAAGLVRFEPDSETLSWHRHQPGATHSLSNDVVWSIRPDPLAGDRILWVATSHGLNRLDTETGLFTRFMEQKGLPNVYIYGIVADGLNRLWLSTNHGLSCFDSGAPAGRQFKNYDASDSLQGNEFNRNAYHRLRSGELIFGGSNGLTRFDPDRMTLNSFVPPVVLTGFRVLNREVSFGQDISDISSIELSHGDNAFSFEFAALNYENAAKNQYAYMMEGFDEDWVHCGTRRTAYYTNLGPGAYTFRVRGSNNDGVWNEQGLAVEVTIAPPFWRTWWYRAGTSAALLGLLVALYSYRVNMLKRATTAQEELSRRLIEVEETERKRIARELHDSLGQNLLVIRNGIQHYLEGLPPKAAPPTELEALSDAALESINEVRQISHNLHPHILDRLGLRRAIESMIRKLAETSGMAITFDLDELDGQFHRDDEIHIYRIVQEGLNNVVKHAGAKRASVAAQRMGDGLSITIQDDGKGFDSAAAGTGFGLAGIRERVRLLKGTLRIISKPGEGTKLHLKIPKPRSRDHDQSQRQDDGHHRG